MNNYRVAKSYEGFEFDIKKAYKNRKGKMVVDAKKPCSRCNGSGIAISHVCNGQPIPYVNDGGICYACNGTGYFHKTIRLYTDKEFEQMEKASIKAAEKREAAREQKMKAEYANKRAKWLEENCFNENLTTFVYFPANSFEVKDSLKDAGFKFNSSLLWHAATIPTGYEESCIEVSFNEIGEFSAWGEGHFNPDVKKIIEDKIKKARPASKSQWIGKEKDKIYDYPVVLKSIRGVETRYGYTKLLKFEDADCNELNWWTTVDISAEVGSKVLLTGTIKKLDEYQGKKITILTRCKIKEV